MGIVSTSKTHSNTLKGSKDPRTIDQPSTIDGIAGDAPDAFGIPNLVVNVGLISNGAPSGIAVDLEQNGLVLNAGSIEATGTEGVGVRIVSQAAGRQRCRGDQQRYHQRQAGQR